MLTSISVKSLCSVTPLSIYPVQINGSIMVTVTGQILNSGICKLILDAVTNTVVMFFKLLILGG